MSQFQVCRGALCALVVAIALADLAVGQDFSTSTSDSAVGYIDNAQIRNRFRFRYDSYWNTRNPDRAEYMFPLPIGVGGRASIASGPLDWDEYRAYTELAFGNRFSLFGDFGIRDVSNAFAFDPIAQRSDFDQAGASDTFVGFRVGLIADDQQQLTAQLKVGIPTGDPRRCLGTGHSSLEAGLLFNRQQSDRLSFFGELKDWVSINAYGAGVPTANSSNVISYGFGLGYDVKQGCRCGQTPRVTAVFETLGWTVLEGLRSTGIPAAAGILVDASGESIFNAKYGLRFTQGRHSMYAGYGHSLTGHVWYEDVLRVEYTRNF